MVRYCHCLLMDLIQVPKTGLTSRFLLTTGSMSMSYTPPMLSTDGRTENLSDSHMVGPGAHEDSTMNALTGGRVEEAQGARDPSVGLSN